MMLQRSLLVALLGLGALASGCRQHEQDPCVRLAEALCASAKGAAECQALKAKMKADSADPADRKACESLLGFFDPER